MFLDVDRLTPIFTYIDKSPIEIEGIKERDEPDAKKIATLLNLATKMVEMDRFVYHTQDGRNLVNLKW